MYSHCIHCQSTLGRNALIEAFPVGRTLAFDEAKGRLWVVCRQCARWNLSPLEERWEAIETCARLYRSTPLRASTDQIGLAKTREGTTLVRIGAPTRPEFASWRYGREFARRRWKSIAYGTGLGLMSVGAVAYAFGNIVGATPLLPFGGLVVQVPNVLNIARLRRAIARFDRADGTRFTLRAANLDQLVLERAPETVGGWQLRVKWEQLGEPLVGPPAERLLARALAAINGSGGSPATVDEAVAVVSAAGSREAVFDRVLTSLEKYKLREWRNPPPAERLALEMALHEDTERAALEGDLAALTCAWQEAESIAQIADDLLLPSWIRVRFSKRSL